jgi:hypothetical protein
MLPPYLYADIYDTASLAYFKVLRHEYMYAFSVLTFIMKYNYTFYGLISCPSHDSNGIAVQSLYVLYFYANRRNLSHPLIQNDDIQMW